MEYGNPLNFSIFQNDSPIVKVLNSATVHYFYLIIKYYIH